VAKQIDKNGAWGYFDVACQGNPRTCNTRGVRYLNNSHFI